MVKNYLKGDWGSKIDIPFLPFSPEDLPYHILLSEKELKHFIYSKLQERWAGMADMFL